jgi:hypothetical protein
MSSSSSFGQPYDSPHAHDGKMEVDDPTGGPATRLCVTLEPGAWTFRAIDGAQGVSLHGELRSNETPTAEPAWRVPRGVPLRCAPHVVPKPWGREIWYTGIEKRGVCLVGGVPFTWLLAAARREILGDWAGDPVLLKVLDPVGVPVLGDLYTEIHAQKNEVYVCTHVDPVLYPDGTGWLRYGISPAAWNEAGGDSATFKASYLCAVKEYEGVRRGIDDWIDANRSVLEGSALLDQDAPVEAALLARWHQAAPAALREAESVARARMNAFTALHPMRVGSVARVPVGVPHALQAGVRVVEFQTATYERSIVSFAQKVLTQPHWDTPSALELLDVEESRRCPLVPEDRQAPAERIVDFPGFEAWRLRVSSVGGPVEVGSTAAYELIYVVEGALRWSARTPSHNGEALIVTFDAGAWLLPCGALGTLEGEGLVLRAFPRKS